MYVRVVHVYVSSETYLTEINVSSVYIYKYRYKKASKLISNGVLWCTDFGARGSLYVIRNWSTQRKPLRPSGRPPYLLT